MSIIERYNKTVYGEIQFAGNSLLVSKRENGERVSVAFTADENISSHIENDTSKTNINPFSNYPVSFNYQDNFATTTLILPQKVEVLYSELIWSGIYYVDNSGLSEDELNSPISFILPNGERKLINADLKTSVSSAVSISPYVKSYVRSADVTNLVKENGSGTYAVSSIPAYFDNDKKNTIDYASCGFTLSVIYSFEEIKNHAKKKIIFYVGLLPQNEITKSSEVVFSDFKIKNNLNPKACLCLSGNCEASKNGASSAYFSEDTNDFKSPISSSNNLPNNFFAPQINNRFGFVDTLGSFGTLNHLFSNEGCNSDSLGRDGFFLTSIPISNSINKEKSSGTFKIVTKDNFVCLNSAALCIDSEGDDIMVTNYETKINSNYNDSDLTKIEAFKKGDYSKLQGDLKSAELKIQSLKEANSILFESEKKELLCQALIDKLYTYNIIKIKSAVIGYESGKIVKVRKMPALIINYLITINYIDNCGDIQSSVKRGSCSFIDISEEQLKNCSVRIQLNSHQVCEHEVVIKGCVKLYSN